MLNVPVVVSWVPQRLAAAEGARRSEEAHETATRRSIRLRSALVALAGWALAAPALAIAPSLVADIHPGFQSEGSNPHGFVAVGGRSLFISGDDVLWSTAGVPGDPISLGFTGLHGVTPVFAGGRGYFTGCADFACALWSTDGTPAGTRQVVKSSGTSTDPLTAVAPAGLPRTLVNFTLSFEPVLWRTDGTAAGSGRVMTAQRPRNLVSFQAQGWFFADQVNAPGTLFATNGLPGGTRRVGNVTHGSGLTPVGNRLVFFSGRDLWSSDGTAAGTRKLATLSGSVFSVVTVGGRAFLFSVDFAGFGRDLWTTDGTSAGTRRLLSTASGGSNDPILALGGKAAFFASDATHGTELWSSDGTSGGTRLVKDVCPGTCSGVRRLGASANGRVWFTGFTPTRGAELWTSNLTPAGTRQVRDTCPGTCGGNPGGFLAAGNRLYFTAGEAERSLWESDGTTAGTLRLTMKHPTETLEGVPLGGSRIAFAGFDADHGLEPWISDGTVAGTRQLVDINSVNRAGSSIESMMAAGGRAIFLADDGTTGRELWVSDGTEAGTHLAYDQNPGPASSRLYGFNSGEAGGRLVFSAQDPQGPSFLIGSDGTPAGSHVLLPEETSIAGSLLRAGNRLFLPAHDPVHDTELWATDGTPGGTVRLTDFGPSSPFRPSGGPPILYALGDRAIAPVLGADDVEELWISDGTPGGTQPLHQVYPFLEAPFEHALSQPAQLGGFWYFVVADPDAGTSTLWRTDLSVGGTGAVDVLDLSATSGEWKLYPLGDRMIVFGASPSGRAIWVSDGTVLGTRIVRFLGVKLSAPPVSFDGRLWFLEEFSSPQRLWSTDGTAAGTALFFDEFGGQNPGVEAIQAVGDRLVMATQTRFLSTDGTLAGTAPIEIQGRVPFENITLQTLGVGGQMFFPWDDGTSGAELWVIRPE